MAPVPPPLAFFLLLFSGWVNRSQQAVIDYLLEENRVLRVVNGSRRLRLTDDERRLLEGALDELRAKYVEASKKGPSRIVTP